MNTTTPTATPQTAAPDLYRTIHKGLRHAIFDVTVRAGSTDGGDAEAVTALVTATADLVDLLRRHAAHEDAHIDPALQRHAPEAAARVQTGHDASDRELDALAAAAGRLVTSDDPRGAVAALYDRLADFTVTYLAHLREGESVAMPALAEALTPVEIADIGAATRGGIGPDEMCRFLAVMFPAMDLDERVAMLRGMSAAPPPVYARFAEVARGSVEADTWAGVASHLESGA